MSVKPCKVGTQHLSAEARAKKFIEEECKPLTLGMAKNLEYRDQLYVKGSFNSKGIPETWRVNGKPKTWKKLPDKVSVPIKHGLRDFGYLTENNIDQFVVAKGMRW
jgi:hypothetical protein